MIGPLLLANALNLQAPPPAPEGPFAPPRIFTLAFDEAIKTPSFHLTERVPFELASLRRPAAHPWLRLALGLLANDSFERWEQDPNWARRTAGQPPWSWPRFGPPKP